MKADEPHKSAPTGQPKALGEIEPRAVPALRERLGRRPEYDGRVEQTRAVEVSAKSVIVGGVSDRMEVPDLPNGACGEGRLFGDHQRR